MKKILLIISSIILLTACNNDDNGIENYLIFGHYYGNCSGEECNEYFRVTETELFEYEDNCTPGILSSCIPNSEKLSDAKFEFAKDLITNLPDELFDEAESTLGCPDCVDQGGLYLEIKKDDQIKFWYLDNQNSGLPAYLQNYADEIRAAIEAINN